MIELLRNCSHGSEVATYLVADTTQKTIRKTAWTPEGIINLQAEARGWAWYSDHRPGLRRSYCRVHEKPGGFSIEIDWIEGRKGNFTNRLIANAPIIEMAINHYVAVWKDVAGEHVPMHGDYSIDNLILNAEGVHVIDWEHFAMDSAPWGFDATYLLFETLWFSIRQQRDASEEELGIIRQGLDALQTTGKLSKRFTDRPLSGLLEFIRSHADLWGEQLRMFPNKLPVLNFTEHQVAQIDQRLERSGSS